MPLILAGDEVGNTQDGNNNAYCQDNETGWIGWRNLGREGEDFTGFIGRLTDIRRRFPQLRARRWVDGRRADGSYGVLWLTPQGGEMTGEDWNFPEGRFVLCAGTCEWRAAAVRRVNAAPEPIGSGCRTCPNIDAGGGS